MVPAAPCEVPRLPFRSAAGQRPGRAGAALVGAVVGVLPPAGVTVEPACTVTVWVVPAPGAAALPHAARPQQASAARAAGQVSEERRAGARRGIPPTRRPGRGAG